MTERAAVMPTLAPNPQTCLPPWVEVAMVLGPDGVRLDLRLTGTSLARQQCTVPIQRTVARYLRRMDLDTPTHQAVRCCRSS